MRPKILVLEGLSGASECIREAGGEPVTVWPSSIREVDAALSGDRGPIHGMLLTGGGDVDPRLYDRKPRRETYGVSETRDMVEMIALDKAAENGWPVMGICRGAQIIAVHGGAVVRQHIKGHRGGMHTVEAEPGSLFERAAGTDAMRVLSLHHQEVMKPGKGYTITGWALDGTAEAVESDDGRELGVQFHPEMDTGEYADSLFRWLVIESATRAGLSTPSRVEQRPRAPWRTTPRRRTARPLTNVTVRAAQGRMPSSGRLRLCPHCAMLFDEQRDRDDHATFLHPAKAPKQQGTNDNANQPTL